MEGRGRGDDDTRRGVDGGGVREGEVVAGTWGRVEARGGRVKEAEG